MKKIWKLWILPKFTLFSWWIKKWMFLKSKRIIRTIIMTIKGYLFHIRYEIIRKNLTTRGSIYIDTYSRNQVILYFSRFYFYEWYKHSWKFISKPNYQDHFRMFLNVYFQRNQFGEIMLWHLILSILSWWKFIST